MSGIQTKQALKYVVMPGIIPRFKHLFTSGFGYIAFLMASIYNMVRLLPYGHPYLNPKNIGRYGIRHVIAEAANHLVLSRKNIDQIVIFCMMITGIVLLILMLGSVLISFLFGYAFAAGPGLFSMFVTANPQTDLAYILMDQVFGLPDFFNSCVATSTACFPGQTTGAFPWPFHEALHELFRFYSLGILFIGFMIFLYFIVVVVVETATSGTPFGQRFKNMWVPVRLVVAIGLLIPLNYGYNSGQYITFAAAKFGSSFATNAWLLYNNTIESQLGSMNNPTGEGESLVAMPKPPDASVLAQMMSVVHTCAFGYWFEAEEPQKTAANMPDDAGRISIYQNQNMVKPYLWKNPQASMSGGYVTDNSSVRLLGNGTSYEDALGFYGRGDIIIRFGRLIDKNGNNAPDDGESVEATCGDVRVRINDKRLAGDADVPAGAYLGAVEVQRYYYTKILNLWYDAALNLDYIQFSGRSYLRAVSTKNSDITPCDIGCSNPHLPSCTAMVGTPPEPMCRKHDITNEWKQNAIDVLQADIDSQLTTLWANYNQNAEEAAITPEILDYGWAGAGIWFNTLAQLNGAFASAYFDHPSLDDYPAVMKAVMESKTQSDTSVGGVKGADVNSSNDLPVDPKNTDLPQSASVGTGMYRVHDYWNRDAANNVSTEKISTAGAMETTMNMVFGTNGLFAMVSENAHIHPLAQLVALGKGLVESAIRNITGATVLAGLGGLAKAMDVSEGALAEAASGFIMSTAFIGLTAGLVLYYIVPFLPFVYFFFAVGSWLKTIFEAMVGVPLWALAHLRLDGEGLPGDAAANGYFLIFEIFVRPILSVFGLIAALIIFTAQVRILNFTWMIVTENAGGFTGDSAINIIGNLNLRRSVIDQFFFTIMYAVVVYMMATASFKLIDKIPDNILRWMGQGVSSFSDINQDPAEGLTRYGAMGGLTAGQQLTGALSETAGGAGKAIGGGLRRMMS